MHMFKKMSLFAGASLVLAVTQASAQTSQNTIDPNRTGTSPTEDTNQDGKIDSFDANPNSASGMSGTGISGAGRNPSSAPLATPPSAADGANPVTGTPGGLSTGTGINTSPVTPGATGVNPSTGMSTGTSSTSGDTGTGTTGVGTGTGTGTGSVGGGR